MSLKYSKLCEGQQSIPLLQPSRAEYSVTTQLGGHTQTEDEWARSRINRGGLESKCQWSFSLINCKITRSCLITFKTHLSYLCVPMGEVIGGANSTLCCPLHISYEDSPLEIINCQQVEKLIFWRCKGFKKKWMLCENGVLDEGLESSVDTP